MDSSSDQIAKRYVTCRCQHCNGGIEFDANELENENGVVPCPHCGFETKLQVPVRSVESAPDITPVVWPTIHVPFPDLSQASAPKPRKKSVSHLSKLTKETIQAKIKNGDTPLHRAARTGKIADIPEHLLSIELFLVKNNYGYSPIHEAAKHGHLNQIPAEFLTKETLTNRITWGSSTEYLTGAGAIAQTETPLHIAVRCGYADQIPKGFFAPEFLCLRATGYQTTLLHYLAGRNRLDLVPAIYTDSEAWNLTDYHDVTPRETLARKLRQETYVADVRREPATEKQKDKLRYFGCTWQGEITKGQASDALDECVKRCPDRNISYYNQPATEEQRRELQSVGKNPDQRWGKPRRKPLTYGEAKDWIWDCRIQKRTRDEKKPFA